MPGGGWRRLNKLIEKQVAAKPVYDAIIVGAGISGLMAATLLRDLNICVLERKKRPGGRIDTRQQQGVYYDMGAVFGYPAQGLPFEVESSPRIDASPRIGIHTGDRVIYADAVTGCLQQLFPDSPALQQFIQGEGNAAGLPDDVYTALNAFFQVIHPGDMRDYMSTRQQDALKTFNTAHYTRGNSEMVDTLVNALSGKIRLDAEVLAIDEDQDRVRVRYRKGDTEETLFAKHVLLSCPAPISALLLPESTPQTREYLQAWEYAGGTVVLLAVKDAKIDDFSYLVTPAAPISTIIQQRTADPDIIKLLVYYAGAKHEAIKSLSDEQLIGATIQAVLALNIGQAAPQNLHFADVQRWEQVGPVITQENADLWHESITHPSERVWLVGEYTLNPNETIPFGMMPALQSGLITGQQLRQQLKDDIFRENYLIRATIYELKDAQPVFLQTVEEGNIAYNGLILQATQDSDLQHYLWRHSVDSLWEYQLGFNPTAEDSLLVMEGLLASGVSAEALLPSLEKLVETFYKEEDGAFHTVLQGRAAYWRGASVDATAHAATLMQQLAPEKYARQVQRCAAFIVNSQQAVGYWQSRWFASHYVTTYYAARFLALFEGTHEETLTKTRQFLLQTQMQSGAWQHSVIDTATAILALQQLTHDKQAMRRGQQWLKTQKTASGWRGEVILYYWYDLNDGQRLFYHCTDKGQITSAWATLALRL